MSARRVATAMVAATVLFLVVRSVLALSTGSLTDQAGVVFNGIYAVGTILFSAMLLFVGWSIVTRQTRNAIGWILLAIPLVGAFALFCGDYATQALKNDPGSLPFGTAAAWFDRWLIVLVLTSFIPVFLLFPDGRVPSPRWRPILWVTIVAPATTLIAFALTPGPMTGAFADLTDVTVMNPLGVAALEGPLHAITVIAGLVTFLMVFPACAAIVVRYRSATGEVRQQIRWLAFIGVLFTAELVIGIVTTALLGDQTPNVAKYARATSATIDLAQDDGHLRYVVHDDGAGFDTDATVYGTGLQGMADRLEAIGGSITVESTLGNGTTVTGTVPVGGATS